MLTNLTYFQTMNATMDIPHSDSEDQGDCPITKALGSLKNALNDGGNVNEDHHGISVPLGLGYVDIFVMFDKAHTLMSCYDDHKESHFVVLRWALSALATQPLFSFFLSTTGKVTQFGQPCGHNASGHINDGYLASPHPFIFIGFDLLVGDCKI
jgi:hypothetical protein